MSGKKKIIGAVAGLSALYLANKYRIYNNLDCDFASNNCTLDPLYFSKRSIWITGASSGIGKGLALYLASLDVNVKLILSSRRENVLNEVKHEIVSTYPQFITDNDIFVLPLDCNINEYAYYESKYAAILSKFGITSIDMLVNNAGFSMRSYLSDFAPTDSQDMIQTNLMTPILLSHLVLPDMLGIGRQAQTQTQPTAFGHIINVESAAARLYPGCRTTYSATKAGLLAFGAALQDEIAEYPDVTVTNVLPGLVKTRVDVTARGKFGKGHAKEDTGIQNGMRTERCAEIICAAVSNRLGECWPADQPVLDMLYKAYLVPWYFYKQIKSKTIFAMLKEQAYPSSKL